MTTHVIWALWVQLDNGPLFPTGARKDDLVAIPGQRCAPVDPVPSYYLAAFAQFSNKWLIAGRKFERHVKDHLSMPPNTVLRRSKNDTSLRAFAIILPFSGLHQAAQCQRPYSKRATDRPFWWLTGPLLRCRPHLADRARAEAPRCWPRLVKSAATFPTAEAMWQAKNGQLFKCTQKCVLSFAPRDTKQEFREPGMVVFHMPLEFSACDEPFVRKLSKSG